MKLADVALWHIPDMHRPDRGRTLRGEPPAFARPRFFSSLRRPP
jgi:hypothetical protein